MIPMTTPHFESFEQLTDAVREKKGIHYACQVKSAVYQAACQNYRARHGRGNERGEAKEEKVVQASFVETVNDFIAHERTMSDVSDIILDSRSHVAVAWAIAQVLRKVGDSPSP